MTHAESHPLPVLYAHWLDALLPGVVPSEPLATCDDCPMCGPGTGAPYPFAKDVKCCVYMPQLPNFLVGGVLAGGGPGAERMTGRIQGRIGVHPLGVSRPPSWQAVFTNTVNAIGRSRALRCPYLDGDDGTCTIYGHRDHMCTTWFCRNDRGRTAVLFWNALRDLLQTVETDLSWWCALQQEVEPHTLAPHLIGASGLVRADQIDGEMADGVVNDATHQRNWGRWSGREDEYYRGCASLVAELDWEDVLGVGGPLIQARAQQVRKRFDDLVERRIPERLAIGRFETIAVGDQGTAAITHNAFDPVTIPTLAMSVLHYFQGQPTSEALRRIEVERGLTLDAPLILQLVDWGVLVGV